MRAVLLAVAVLAALAAGTVAAWGGRTPRPATATVHAASLAAPTGKHRQPPLPPSASRPCSLVTAAEARVILRARVLAPLQVPQGPTCLYRTASGRRHVTLAVQAASIKQLRGHLRHARRVRVRGRSAWCGTYGRPMLYLPLPGRRVLSLEGPCATTRAFAARAASRL